jgi:3-oxoacyl-[acyl-carrier protein] reductase
LVLNLIVIGDTRGLGLGIARNLTAASYSVIAIARQQSVQLASAMREVQREAALGTSGLLAALHNAQIERIVRLNTVSPSIPEVDPERATAGAMS